MHAQRYYLECITIRYYCKGGTDPLCIIYSSALVLSVIQVVEAAHVTAKERRPEIIRAEFHGNRPENPTSLGRHCGYGLYELRVRFKHGVCLLQAEYVCRCARCPAHNEGHWWKLEGEYSLDAVQRNERVVTACEGHEVVPSTCVLIEPCHSFC